MAAKILSTALLLGVIRTAYGQAIYNDTSGAITCSSPLGAYCAGDSLSTNIIIRCVDGIGQPGNCNDNLAGAYPVGVKPFAPCYQSSTTAADAVCSWNNVGYPDDAAPFPICNTSAASSSSSSGAAQGTGTATTSSTTKTSTGSTTSVKAATKSDGQGTGTQTSTNTSMPTTTVSGMPSAAARANFGLPAVLLPVVGAAVLLVG